MNATTPDNGGGLREELRGDATTLTDTAKNTLHSQVDARKSDAVSQAQSLSSALDKAAGELDQSPDWLKSAFRQGAQTIQRFADSIEHKDSRQLTRDVQQFARTNPATFLGACAAAGFAAARVMKAGVDTSSTSAGTGSQGSYGASSGSQQGYEPYSAYSTGGSTSGSNSVFAGMETERQAETTFQGGVA